MRNLISLAEAAKVIPVRPSTNVVWRWCRKGLKARNGQTIRLKHCRIGGKIYIRPEDIETFFNLLATADTEHFDNKEGCFSNPFIKPGRKNKKNLEEAENFLKKEGVL